jgi:hypothetical protein
MTADPWCLYVSPADTVPGLLRHVAATVAARCRVAGMEPAGVLTLEPDRKGHALVVTFAATDDGVQA